MRLCPQKSHRRSPEASAMQTSTPEHLTRDGNPPRTHTELPRGIHPGTSRAQVCNLRSGSRAAEAVTSQQCGTSPQAALDLSPRPSPLRPLLSLARPPARAKASVAPLVEFAPRCVCRYLRAVDRHGHWHLLPCTLTK